MLSASLLLLAALHAVQTPRSLTGKTNSGGATSACSLTATIEGNVIFPAYSNVVHNIDMELRSLPPDPEPLRFTSGPYESFLLREISMAHPYELYIELPGFDIVQQLIVFTPDLCDGGTKFAHSDAAVLHFDIQLHLSPAIKPSPIAEDAVSIKTLMSKVPDNEVDAFDKSLDRESKVATEQTVASLKEILQMAPNYYDANLELGLEYRKQADVVNSSAALAEALRLNNGSMRARAALGEIRFNAGDFQAAAQLLGDALKLGSTSPGVYYLLGSSYYKLDQLALAEAALRRALAINPDLGQAHLQLFNVYMKANERAAALKEAAVYLEKNPNASDHDYVQSMLAKYSARSTAPAPATADERAPMSPELQAVIQKATDYVAKYETELGSLIGTEEYLQQSVWPGVGKDMSGACPKCPKSSGARTMTRRTSSDFMLIQVGDQWTALREVNTVDGRKVKNEAPPLDARVDGNSLKADSTKYNIGDVHHEANLPTFALQVLRKNQSARFGFEQAGAEKIDGVETWRVRFREFRGPSLVSANGGRDLLSNGTLWIEPETGRVLKTDFRVDNRYDTPVISSRIVVTYSADKTRDILVPATMTERYETSSNIIDCQAEYSHFHPYTVDVKFDTSPSKP